ncbi:hypothetical protein Hanom_Chr13g01243521 [Helianthus anomalus]
MGFQGWGIPVPSLVSIIEVKYQMGLCFFFFFGKFVNGCLVFKELGKKDWGEL